MSATVIDTSIIKHDVARRNGLSFFEVVIKNWGLINPQTAIVGPIGQSMTVLDDGVELELPSGVSLAGASIGPMSTVDQVILSPDPNSYVGIKGLNPQAIGRAVGNIGGAIGGQFTFEEMCSVEAPLNKFMPGRVTIKAATSTRFRVDNQVNGRMQFLEPNTQAANLVNATLVREPVLQLYCWIRDPGPAAWPTKRPPYYDWERLDGQFAQQSEFEDTTVACWPIMGRKRVAIEAWLTPRLNSGFNDMYAGMRVLLHRATGPQTSSNLSWDQPFIMRSEQVWPPVENIPQPVSTQQHAQDYLQNEAGPNKLQVLINNPMATFVEVRAGCNNDQGSIYASIRAED